MYSTKKVVYKKCGYCSKEIFLERFWDRKLTMNVQISWFLTPLCHLSVTDIKKTFFNIWFLCKSEACVKCCRHKRHNPNLVTHRKEGVVPLAPGGPPDRWPTCPPHLYTCLPPAPTCPAIRRPACQHFRVKGLQLFTLIVTLHSEHEIP